MGSKKISKTIFFLIYTVFVITFPLIFSSAAQTYVGSKNSDVYHYPTCPSAKLIKPENLISFSSPEEARAAGYRPCLRCNPPTSSSNGDNGSNGEEGKESSALSCTASSPNIEIGNALTISGTIAPARSGVTVTIQYTKPYGTTLTRTTTSDSGGSFSDTYTPLIPGTWYVLASWAGDVFYEGASSTSQQVTVWEQSIAGDIEINQTTTCTSIVDGDSFHTVFGEIRLADIDAPEFYEEGYDDAASALSSLILNKPMILDIDDVYQMDYVGTGDRYVCLAYVEVNATHLLNVNKYLVYHSYAEIDDFSNEFTPFSWALYYPKPSTSITCTVNPSTIIQGNSLTVSGTITPSLSGIPIILRYERPDSAFVEHEVMSDVESAYSDVFTPTTLGVWKVAAEWDGDSLYHSSTSAIQSFTVSKNPSAITCLTNSSSIEIGDSIILSGSLTPVRADEIITLSYRDSGDWATLTTVSTDADGSYAYTWTPSTLGSYQLQALWAGDVTYDAALSSNVALDVTKILRSISCVASTSTLIIGESVSISCETDPPISGENITIYYRDNNAWETLGTVTSLDDGSYAYTWTPSVSNAYQLQARWPS